jgi:hypothetical protein
MRPSIVSRAILPGSLTVPPEILRLVRTVRISFSEPLVRSGISGRSSTRSSWSLWRWRRAAAFAQPAHPGYRRARDKKVYSCIGKGKAHKPYEFGVRVRFCTGLRPSAAKMAGPSPLKVTPPSLRPRSGLAGPFLKTAVRST